MERVHHIILGIRACHCPAAVLPGLHLDAGCGCTAWGARLITPIDQVHRAGAPAGLGEGAEQVVCGRLCNCALHYFGWVRDGVRRVGSLGKQVQQQLLRARAGLSQEVDVSLGPDREAVGRQGVG